MIVNVDDIIQITNQDHNWFGCILIVSECKSWGVQAYVPMPLEGDAYIRLETNDFEVVGKAVIVAE